MGFETPWSLSNRSVSRVQTGRGFFGGQLCVFVWRGGFWVEEEELCVPAARYPGGQRGAMQELITQALPPGVGSEEQPTAFA